MSKTSDTYVTYYKYNKKNEKDPVVFIHGIGLTHEIWDDQIVFFKNYNTIVYDLIGHGKTPLNKKQINMKDFCKQLLKLIDELNRYSSKKLVYAKPGGKGVRGSQLTNEGKTFIKIFRNIESKLTKLTIKEKKDLESLFSDI